MQNSGRNTRLAGRAARLLIRLAIAFVVPCSLAEDWSSYGSDPGGSQYSALDQINTTNVSELEIAWHYRTGDKQARPEAMKRSAFEVTPIILDNQLIFCTQFNEVISLDPVTGEEQWRFDPRINLQQDPANQFICRGVSHWQASDTSNPKNEFCASRIFMGTNDRRLIALDRPTGKLCPDFGDAGQVTLDTGMPLRWDGEFQITSPPAIINDIVIVGSAIGDNLRSDAPRGVVRAFNTITGEPAWQFDPIPLDKPESWKNNSAGRTGHANVWAPISVDSEKDLGFLPTSSPSPDFFGGERPGDNRYANSLVAIRGSTGEVVWHFQTIHHDVFDYDLPAQPTLTTLIRDGKDVPAVIQPTKTGLLFAFNRLTGEPLFEIEEIPVPQSDILGEATSPTQPIPVKPAPLSATSVSEDDMWGLALIDEWMCARQFKKHRNDGMFTPPSLQGSIEMPFTGGGVNWGGIAVEPQEDLVLINTNNAIHVITLFPAEQFSSRREQNLESEISPQEGTDFGMRRDLLLSPFGVPCNSPPWGVLSAVNMNTGEIKWQSTLGTTEDLAPLGITLNTGTPNFGGPMVTGGGLAFIGATMDYYIRAFDLTDGAELWKGRLPTGGQATPMTYQRDGRQFVVIAAGGHARMGIPTGDSIIAYALPR